MNPTTILAHNALAAATHSGEESTKFYATALSEAAKEIEDLRKQLAEATKPPDEPAPT